MSKPLVETHLEPGIAWDLLEETGGAQRRHMVIEKYLILGTKVIGSRWKYEVFNFGALDDAIIDAIAETEYAERLGYVLRTGPCRSYSRLSRLSTTSMLKSGPARPSDGWDVAFDDALILGEPLDGLP